MNSLKLFDWRRLLPPWAKSQNVERSQALLTMEPDSEIDYHGLAFVSALCSGVVREFHQSGMFLGYHVLISDTMLADSNVKMEWASFWSEQDGSFGFEGITPFSHGRPFGCLIEDFPRLVYVRFTDREYWEKLSRSNSNIFIRQLGEGKIALAQMPDGAFLAPTPETAVWYKVYNMGSETDSTEIIRR